MHAEELAVRVIHHPYLNGRPCDKDGNFLPRGLPPSPAPLETLGSESKPEGYLPFDSRIQFEIADFLYRRVQMSGSKIDELMQLWACTLPEDQDPPFTSHQHLYATIDAVSCGEVPWQTFSVSYNGAIPDGAMPSWMIREYDVWFRDPRLVLRNQYSNPDFAADIHWAPRQLLLANGKRQYRDFMSGDWAWKEADTIAQDPRMHGATLATAIFGSDKTTVSVATGQNEYYPLYMTNGGVTNSVRRAHRNAITLIGFLAIPKTERHYQNDAAFRKFRRELFHTSLRAILDPLRCSMTSYEVLRCADGHYRRMVFSLGPYIADYPEQVLLACTVQGWCPRCTAKPGELDTGQASRRSHKHTKAALDALDLRSLWDDYGIVGDLTPFTSFFPRADIHELLSPDLLHQVIKGTFKDHLVSWVEDYLVQEHGKAGAAVIMADIDRRIAAVPSFPGLRRFPEGRGFKQWTGDDSKALMKVYLPAISGHIPPQMVRALSAFLEFCYLVQRDTLDDDTLDQIDSALERYHQERVIFEETGVRANSISLPRQHALKHYRRLIQLFASPNGLCSSMMEAKHITAVKKPYRRSSHNKPLGQIILINQRLDKLAALRVDLDTRHMLEGPCPRLPPYMQPDAARAGAADSIPAALDESSSDEDNNDDAELDRQHHEPQAADTAGGEPRGDDGAAEPEEGAVGDLEGPALMAECVLSKTPLRGYPKHVRQLAQAIHVPALPDMIRRFLYNQLTPNPGPGVPTAAEVPLESCPLFDANISVFPSAIATYYAPSDPSGPRGMHRERIRSVGSWRGEGPRRDCVSWSKARTFPDFAVFWLLVNQFWTLSISIAWCAVPISSEWLGTNTSPTVYDTLIL
ncbi:hypothetical protein BN946_scf184403.g17 [Trametes cinnabarina]|uniref:CxC2-like cysteine cluster KDZ transposase-associated domain-containing protein n=1 Tax=Pycnoporus cinnabarinus TaxID=5643 RepID=A0A060SR58_PYCCI|nr:hypothetical protein BN946_scf184403.g17 [Trametes cinnabarina]